MAKKITLLIISDLHAGSTVGLCTPTFQLPDGGTYGLSHAQQWLYQNWNDLGQKAIKAAKGGKFYFVSNGDLIDGKVKQSVQTVTDSMVAQREIAAELLDPLVQQADKFFVIRGTEAHVGGIAQHEEGIAKDFGAEKSESGTYSHWQLLADFGGVLFDFAHHVGGGGRPWTSGGNAVRLAAETVMDYAGGRIPQLVFRSHVHKYADSFINVAQTRAIITPAWQLRTAYGYRIAARPADVGGVIVTIEAGRADVNVVLFKPERPTIWHAQKE